MKYWQPIIRLLLKLFLIGSSQLFYVPSVCAQDSSSLSEEDREKHVSSQSWQEYLMELSEMEDFEQTVWEDYAGAASAESEYGYPRRDGASAFPHPFAGRGYPGISPSLSWDEDDGRTGSHPQYQLVSAAVDEQLLLCSR